MNKPRKPKAAASGGGDDNGFRFSSGIPNSDKSEYLEKNITFSITGVEHQPGQGFEGGNRWAATVEPDDGRGPEIMTFACNEKRDEQLEQARLHIQRHGPIRDVVLTKSGKAYYFRTPPEKRRAS